MFSDWLEDIVDGLFFIAAVIGFLVSVGLLFFIIIGFLFFKDGDPEPVEPEAVLQEEFADRDEAPQLAEEEAGESDQTAPPLDIGMSSDQILINWAKKQFQEFLVDIRTGPDQKYLIAAQRELGKQVDSRVAGQCDREESPRLRQIAGQLLPYFKQRHSARVHDLEEWKFYVVSSCETFAHVTPASEIYFDRDYLATLVNDSEVAAVVAHEIAHIHLLHVGVIAHAMLDGSPIALGVQLIGDAFVSELYEMEADWLAVQVLGKAGYDPKALVSALNRIPDPRQPFVAPSEHEYFGSLLGWMFRSHPPSEEREAAIRAAVKEYNMRNPRVAQR